MKTIGWGMWAVASAALASSVISVNLDQLTQRSDAVVHGTVTNKQSRWSGDGRRIITDVQIQVSESLKGTPGATVSIQQPGGVVGDIGQSVSGLASFSEGEEVVVFLGKWGKQFQVVGAAQGKFSVQRSSDGKVVAVPDPASEHELVDASGRRVESQLRRLELAELRAAVRAAAGRTP
jgi:hypothetical protein